MGAPVPVARSIDICVGYSTHLYVPIPPPPVPAPVPTYAIEIPINQSWPPGVGLGSVKKTSTVLTGGLSIIQAGHDCGKLIPQITIPINNLLLPTFLPTSKRKVVFNCFSVRMNGAQTALTALWPPVVMLTCGQPLSMPVTLTVTNVCLSVYVGMSLADFVGGVITIAGTMIIDAIVDRFFPKLGPGEKMPFGWSLLQSGMDMVVGLAASGAQHLIDPRYPVKADLSIKCPGDVEVKVSVQAGSSDTKNNPSSVTVGVEKKLGEHKPSGSSAKVGGSATYTWDAGGDTSKEGWKGTAGASGASPVGSRGVSVTGEHHGPAPEGQQNKVSFKDETKTPLGSDSTQTDYNPDAGTTTTHESSDAASPGVHKTTETQNPDGSTTTTTFGSDREGNTTTTKTTQQPDGTTTTETTKGSGPGAAWGPPL